MHSERWNPEMSNLTEQPALEIILSKDLGAGNQGGFGPNSEREASAAKDVAKPEYIVPPTPEIHCMDDGFEGAAAQLPGGLLITEMAGSFMDPEAGISPLSQMVDWHMREINSRGRQVIVHGDSHHGQGGCAANALLREVLKYNHQHEEVIVPLAQQRLRLMNIDDLHPGDVRRAIQTGFSRAVDDSLWDMDAAEVVKRAATHGAEYEEFNRRHNVACSRTDLSGYVFNNGKFRNEHQTDSGEPLGVLSISFGAYKEHLKEDGLEDPAVSKRMLHSVLFSLGILKLAEKDGVLDVIVGQAS